MRNKYIVSLSENRMLIAEYLSKFLGFSSRQAKKLLKEKKVRINGKPAYRDNKIMDGDILEIDMSEAPGNKIAAEAIELSIVYEDENILAVNKPPYMLVHPTPNHPSGTLLNAAAYYFSEKGEEKALRLLNRLDMNTSGIVVLPKSAAVHSRLEEMMESGRIRKFYLAVVEGVLEPNKGVIDKPIGKDEANPIRRRVRRDGQQAVTKYETVKKSGNYSLVRLELITGRTHQIRVHLSSLGHPIVGDSLYGKASELIGRQALHASDMEFPDVYGIGIIKLHAGLPGDIEALVSMLELE